MSYGTASVLTPSAPIRATRTSIAIAKFGVVPVDPLGQLGERRTLAGGLAADDDLEKHDPFRRERGL